MEDIQSAKVSKTLLVDDDQTLLDVLRHNLEKETYHVTTALPEGPGLVILGLLIASYHSASRKRLPP